MPSATVWFGPVSAAQVAGARIPDESLKFVPCTGDGSPTCGQIVDGWLGPDGRLPAMLSKLGLAQDSKLALGAFSAGGSSIKRLCLDAQDRAQLKAIALADAMFEGVPISQGQLPPFAEGFVQYALGAIANPFQLFVATSSAAPNACQGGTKFCGTGIDAMHANMAEIEKRSGQKFEPDLLTFAQVLPAPAKAWRLGNVRFGEWPDVGHGEHATKLAPQVWSSVVIPWWLGGQSEPLPTPSPKPSPTPATPMGGSRGAQLLSFLIGATGGYVGLRAFLPKKKRRA